jgi:NMD protein affecting ribosome stability and mRNA decay
MTRIKECTRCGGSTQDWDIHYDGLCGECVLEVGDFMNEDNQGAETPKGEDTRYGQRD